MRMFLAALLAATGVHAQTHLHCGRIVDARALEVLGEMTIVVKAEKTPLAGFTSARDLGSAESPPWPASPS